MQRDPGVRRSNMQVARRMRALLEDLGRVLPEHRRPSIETELALLDRTIEFVFPYPEDRALARIPDIQGLGGRLSRIGTERAHASRRRTVLEWLLSASSA